MNEYEFRQFVSARVALVLTARMTLSQMQSTVDEIIAQWKQDKAEAYELGRADERSLQYAVEMQKKA